MLIPTIIMAAIAIALFVFAYTKGQHMSGIKSGLMMTATTLPLLVFSFLVAGLVQALLPQDLISKWVGVESGLRGILIGTVAGSLTPGGPYVSMPIAAGLLRAGAGVGTMVAFLASWSLWAVSRLPMEFGILGWKFTIIRIASTIVFPPLAGIIANGLAKLWNTVS